VEEGIVPGGGELTTGSSDLESGQPAVWKMKSWLGRWLFPRAVPALLKWQKRRRLRCHRWTSKRKDFQRCLTRRRRVRRYVWVGTHPCYATCSALQNALPIAAAESNNWARIWSDKPKDIALLVLALALVWAWLRSSMSWWANAHWRKQLLLLRSCFYLWGRRSGTRGRCPTIGLRLPPPLTTARITNMF